MRPQLAVDLESSHNRPRALSQLSRAPSDPGVDDPWVSESTLRQVYGSSVLARKLAELAARPEFFDRRHLSANQVNTALSSKKPVSRWVRYREGYSPELVELLLSVFPPARDSVIVDPMCGSGSTQLAAQALRMRSVGVDVSPYAVLASRVKTSAMTRFEREGIEDWLTRLGRFHQSGPTPPSVNQEALERYFPRPNFTVLCRLDAEIRSTWEPGPQRDFLELALLAILEECSNHRKDGNGLATRPCRISNPMELFAHQVRLMIGDADLRSLERPEAFAVRGSAVAIQEVLRDAVPVLADDVGAVVFSPPYPNSFDYFESYKLELLFTGLVPMEEFSARRKELIRSFRQSGGSSPLVEMPLVELHVDAIHEGLARKETLTGARDQRTRLVPNLLRGYFSDMRDVLRSCAGLLEPGGRVHVVVDQSAYAGVPVATDLLIGDIGTREGFELERITMCRRSKTSGQQLKLCPTLAGLLRETVVTLRRR